MNKNIENLFYDLWRTIISYLPNLFAGILLLLVGWVIGWFVKRFIIQLMVILRFEKLLSRFRWKNALSKADVRFAIYNIIGNTLFVIVFLIFLNAALTAMNLPVLSHLIEQSVLFIPKLLLALTILGVGWMIASRSSSAVVHALLKENIPNSSLIGRVVKFILIVFFFAIALTEIDIASQIVLIGFTVFIISLGVITVLIVAERKDVIKNLFNKENK